MQTPLTPSPSEQVEVAALSIPTSRPDRERYLRENAGAIYDHLTGGLTRSMRIAELVYAAAERYPGLVPQRAEIAAERERIQKDKAGLEIDQGIFIAHVLAHPRSGFHLMHSMSQPKPAALERLAEFRQTGAIDLGPMRLDRRGRVGVVTIQNHAYLNSEDDLSTAALETAIDLALLDDGIEVGVLRGGQAVHPKHLGRRIFGAGINLTHLYQGRISLVEFMLERELGAVSKMYRGHSIGPWDAVELEERREKPWLAAVESFAIGGACQWLLVMDRVIAEAGAYFNLPARKEGIIPGAANLRLPRFTGDRITRQAIFFNRDIPAASPEGRLIADEVVGGSEVEAAIERSALEITSAGMISLLANRRAMRIGQEPLDVFRRYMAGYARDQAYCMYSPALIHNLERNWEARGRALR